LVLGAGFVRVGPKWKEVLCFTLFYEELLRAKGLKKLDSGSIVRIDDEGIVPSKYYEQLGSAKPLGKIDSSSLAANQSDHTFEKFTTDDSSSELIELLRAAEKSLSQLD
ncbi:hypothetical protein KBZ15_16465, partial [Cyanobium sp. BA20m-p-22]|uniref:hypothetical protein n=1 Tax=Cyanobium sp. BA20m-p-22 TaxID=2823704 RepID=UPI0020CCAB6A